MRIERLILAAVFFAGCGGSSGNKNDAGATPTQDLSVPDLSAGTTAHPDLGGGSDGGSSVGEDGGASGAGAIHLTTSATLGSFLVDGGGRSLYIFGQDFAANASAGPTSNCTAGCLTIWPVFHVDTVTVSGNLSVSDFSEFTRADGAKQTVYKGWPLYYFASDAAPGDVKGQGIINNWFVATQPFYTEMVRGDATQKTFLSDGAGRSLYYFTADTRGTTTTPPVSACTASGCAAVWPAFQLSPAVIPSILAGTDFTILAWADGVTKQVVYKGHPLYYFANDAAPGDTKGRGLNNNTWNTLDPTLP